ncbi:MAG TPA: transglycosylase SLT domain-containing protein [Candidatus Krumholzibacteria bacterium]|nr:transglycosylase SLT domain-containing protein [Candidatus Krumholzibacteria bacterium]HRX50946.1 transglycosylase SLT domain-containing protein [Candidatus Krumholzibacteria bacterium]
MMRGRILTLLILLLAVPWARADDAFLERFRVGAYREAAATDARGWPLDLFPAPRDTADDLAELDTLLARLDLADPAPAGARVVAAAPGEAAAVLASWRRVHADRLAQAHAALAAWRDEDWARAAELCAALARDGDAAEAVFVWTLRRDAALERGTGRAPHPSDLWVAAIALGPFDSASGWSLWRARREALGEPLLPAWVDERRSALWLAGLGECGLAAADLQASGFAPELQAALGAAVLPREELAAHFRRHPQPPADAALAGLWARGRQRQERFAVEATEALGARDDLPASVRTDLLRKAADRRITDLQWAEGRAALADAVEQALASGSSWRQRLAGAELRRAEAMARHRGRPDDALALVALQGRLPDQDDDDAFTARLRTRVRAGEATPLGQSAFSYQPGLSQTARDALWPVWAAWGERLCGDGFGWYRDALAAVATAATPAERRVAVERAVATVLIRTEGGRALLHWGLDLDLEAQGRGASPAYPSPVPALIADAPPVRIHAALGLCLLAGDPRGQLACAYALPRGGLTAEQNRRFLYPLPAREAIGGLLAQADDAALALAVARNESLFDPGVRSRSGALGWMQIMPFHYAGDGYEDGRAVWRVPATSVRKGLELLATYAARYHGDPYRAVAAYNAGPGAVDRWDRQLGGEPDRATFLAWIGYPETHRYTEKVLIDREIYAHILEGYRQEDPSTP